MEKEINPYIQGIHLKLFDNESIPTVLKHYNVVELPKFHSIYNNETDSIQDREEILLKQIYDWALYVILINGHCFLLNQGQTEFLDTSIYFNDMIMLLYLYEINRLDPLCVNNMGISKETASEFYKIEQSGYGNILGLRREKDKRVTYISKPQNSEQDEMNKKKYEVKRRKEITKTQIPYPCKDIVSSLLTSIKYNAPFVFDAEKNESSLENVCDEELSKMIFDDPDMIQILNDDIKEMLKYITDVSSKELAKKITNYMRIWKTDNDYNISNEYNFHKRYYNRLEHYIQKEKDEDSREINCRRKANHYLSELLFGYRYTENAIHFINKFSEEEHIDKDIFNLFQDVIYLISEFPVCFARIKHMEQHLKKICDLSKQQHISEKKLKEQIVVHEKYTLQKFLPALFYCFLYYFQTNDHIKNTCHRTDDFLEILEKLVKNINSNFEMQYKKAFNCWASDPIANYLWKKRKVEYFRPLVYDPSKALF